MEKNNQIEKNENIIKTLHVIDVRLSKGESPESIKKSIVMPVHCKDEISLRLWWKEFDSRKSYNDAMVTAFCSNCGMFWKAEKIDRAITQLKDIGDADYDEIIHTLERIRKIVADHS